MKRLKIMIKSYKDLIKMAYKDEKMYFFWVMLNFICYGVYGYSIIQVPRIVLEMLESNTVNFELLIIVFTIIFISDLGISLCKIKYTPVGYRIRYGLMLKYNEKNLSIPLDQYEDPKILDNLWNITRPITSVNGVQFFYLHCAEFSGNFAIILISIGVLLKLNIILAIFIFIWIIIYTFLNVLNSEKIGKIKDDGGSIYRKHFYFKNISMDISFAKEMRVFRLKNWFKIKMNTLLDDMEKFSKLTYKFSAKIMILDNIYQFIRDSIMYITLIILYFDNKINLAQFSMYSVLVMQLNNALSLGVNNIKTIVNEYEKYTKMFDYFRIENEDNKGLEFKCDNDWEIKFDNVSFHYLGSDKNIYENLNFTIKKGKKIAVIGLNGVGKTTLIKLLMRLYKPTDGKILFNGVDIQSFKLSEYYNLFAPVFQEINLFAYSVKENLVFDQEYDDKIAYDALIQVGLKDKISLDQLDKSMTKIIDEDGLLLSGGESQKFAMARAICSNRQVLILDEPTSALDAIAEYDFYHKINNDYKDKTILFISHRLASTSFCDEIILVDDKCIKEHGTHDQLMKLEGKYFELYRVQSKYYQKEES